MFLLPASEHRRNPMTTLPPAAPPCHTADSATHLTPHHDHDDQPPTSRGYSPRGVTALAAILAFTFLNSIGSAVVYAGVFFLSESHYGFTERDNFWLGLLFGVTYIPAALSIGPLLRRLGKLGVSPRAVLAIIMAGMTLLCLLPWAASLGQEPGLAASTRPRWAIWAAVGLYSPLSGALWPIVESFLAGGRSERVLRGAIGKFNICWSSALVVTLLAMSPLVKSHAMVVLNSLAGVHAICAGIALVKFARSPGVHAEHHVRVNQELYTRLLSLLRILLPVAFLFISALSPYLPSVVRKLEVPAALGTIVAAMWYAARVATFFTMERWHGWHGRWSTPIWGLAFLLISFGAVVASPAFGLSIGRGVLSVGLAGFGVGVGVIYAAALYYAMEVGSDGVDAGGMHETLIGIGYSVGPACGLAAGSVVSRGWVENERFEYVMIAMVSGLALIASAWGLLLARRGAGKR